MPAHVKRERFVEGGGSIHNVKRGSGNPTTGRGSAPSRRLSPSMLSVRIETPPFVRLLLERIFLKASGALEVRPASGRAVERRPKGRGLKSPGAPARMPAGRQFPRLSIVSRDPLQRRLVPNLTRAP